MQVNEVSILLLVIVFLLLLIVFLYLYFRIKTAEISFILNKNLSGKSNKKRIGMGFLSELKRSAENIADILLKTSGIESSGKSTELKSSDLKVKQEEIIRQNIELKSAYEALIESRKKYEQIIHNLKDEYIFFSQSPSGDILFVSPSVKSILNFETSDFRQSRGFIFTDNEINKKAGEHKNLSLTGLQQPKYIAEVKDSHGEPHIFEISEFPVFNETNEFTAVEGIARDVTILFKNESIIKEQEQKYKLLFNKASDFVFFYDIDQNGMPGKFIEVNDYTIQRLGYSNDEMKNMTLDDLSKIEYWDNSFVKNENGVNNKFEQVWETKDGNLINVEIVSHTFKLNRKEIGIAIARDITDRKQAEEEIRFFNEELINQKENLEALVDNLTQAQEQLVHSEKMAALGQLIAGVAHEINTPLGAIKASIGNLNDSLGKAIGELPAFLKDRSQEDLKLFVIVLESTGYESDNLTSREKRNLKREILEILEKNQIANADSLSELVIYLNIQKKINGLIPFLNNPNAEYVLRTARNFASILKNSKTISTAADKAAKVVFALKKYAHRDVVAEKQPTDIIDSIETVLTLYQNQLKQGVEVIRKYDSLPVVHCYADEINQVWTNLIHNSLQAMDQKGILTITARNENKFVTVSIADTGCGIEPDIRDKIFEPFFTTKKQGEGSGLGLDIVKKIIEKHNGEIIFTSELGAGTEFTIKLPVN